jgi:hypothetical protein
MITPENQIPQDDQQGEEKDDQRSQQDVHSNGFDEADESQGDDIGVDESDALAQAYDAAESSYTLNLDDEVKPKEDE